MSPQLSRQIEAIEYVHADDGMRYRHDFTRGDSSIDLRKDGSVIIRNAGDRKLWDTFDVDGQVQPFLVNPRGVRDHTVRRTSMAGKTKRSAAQREATRRMIAANRHRNAPRRATKHKKSAKRGAKRNAVTKYVAASRPKHKRNPPPRFTGKGIIKQMGQGLVDAAWILAGKLAAQFVSSKTPFEDGTLPDIGVEVATGLGAAFVLPRFLGIDRARMVLAGTLLAPLETLVSQAKIAGVSNLLTGYPALNGVDTRAVFASGDASRIGKYRADRVIGSYGPPRRIGVVEAPPVRQAVLRARAMPAHMMSY